MPFARRATLLSLTLALALSTGISGREGEFVGVERVQAVEVSMALESLANKYVKRPPPTELSPAELTVLVDGIEVASKSILGPVSEAAARPWQFVIYVDLALSSPQLVASAAATIGANAAGLVTAGMVELVVADPLPRRLLAPSRDAALIDEALSGLLVRHAGLDRLLGLRASLRQTGASSVEERAGLAHELLSGELETIRRQQDRLLSWLVERAEPEPRRVLLLVSGGFDLHPEAFYQAALGDSSWPGEHRLPDDQSEIHRAMAAYGWIAVIVQRPEPDPLPRRWGLRRQLLVRLDGNWDPQRAEAQLELGESLIRQGKWKRAEAALRESAYAFYNQPKRRDRQAYVLSRLGHVLEEQDRFEEAHKVYGKALELDPLLAEKVGLGVARLLDPLEPLAALADATGGGVVRSDAQLGELLAGLQRRLRLVFQLSGSSESGLHALEVRHRKPGYEVLARRWLRSATPTAVSTARVRRLLDEELEVEPNGEQILQADRQSLLCTVGGDAALAKLDVELEPQLPEAWEGVPTAYRVSVATPLRQSTRVAHRSVAGEPWSPGDSLRVREQVEIDPAQPFLSLIVEEMNTGRWLGAVLECDETL